MYILRINNETIGMEISKLECEKEANKVIEILGLKNPKIEITFDDFN